MAATIIDGKEVAARVRAEVARDVAELRERTGRAARPGDDSGRGRPRLGGVRRGKRKACAEAGIIDQHQHLPADVTQAEVAAVIEECNRNPEVSGILLQLPVPAGLNGKELTALISPDKDVDGLTHVSAGRLVQGAPGLRPCTPLGVIELLDSLLGGARGSRGGRGRAVGPGRQAGGVPAARAQRDRDHVSLAHARPRRRVLARGRARGGDRAGGDDRTAST